MTTSTWPVRPGPSTLRSLNNHLLRYIISNIGPDDEAHDILQEVWVAAKRFRGEGTFDGFLFSIARHKVIDWFRKIERRAKAIDRFAEVAADVQDPATSLDSLLARAEESGRLKAAIAELREPFRSTVELRMTGLDMQEIGVQLGVSYNTVRSRLSRACGELRVILGAVEE
jgi:RNA polymerase sigma-70 factor (ECF subfamily)